MGPHREVRCVLNLESMGSGGPQRLFQSTRGDAGADLLRMFSKHAPRPSATVVAADTFGKARFVQARCVPTEKHPPSISETRSSIFRMGKMDDLDIPKSLFDGGPLPVDFAPTLGGYSA